MISPNNFVITYTSLHFPKTIYGLHSWQINMYPCILYNQLQATSKLCIWLSLQKNICTCNVGKPCSPYKHCQDCKIHISGRTLYLRRHLYSQVFSYLDFKVYYYFITIYVHVFVWYAKGSFADVAVSFSFFYCTCIVISSYKAKCCDTEYFSNL